MMDTEDPRILGQKTPSPLPTRRGIRRSVSSAASRGLPTTMLYDRQGIVREKIIGFEYTDVIGSELKPLL